MFKKAIKSTVFLKLGITGPTGSGKTYSALRLARGLTGPQGRIAFVDTENGSASLYSDKFDFDVVGIAPPFEPGKFAEAIREAAEAGYDAVIVDSMSHAWEGTLELKSRLDARPGANSYTNWAQAGEKWKDQLNAALQSPIHVIACLRSKMDYVLETNDKGKQSPRKVGLAPIARDGTEYEFTVVFDVAMTHDAATSKDRTELFGDRIFRITEETGRQLDAWRKGGKAVEIEAAPAKTAQAGNLTTHGTLEKIRSYAIILKKDDAALVKAALWASAQRTGEIADLTEDEGQKVCAEFARQSAATGEKFPEPKPAKKKEEPKPEPVAVVEDVPFVFPSDLAFLEPRKAVVLSYLRKLKWVGESEGLDALPPERCRQIVDRRVNFERALAAHEAEAVA